MKARTSQAGKYWVGAVLILSLLVGGGDDIGLMSERIIELLAITAAAAVLAAPSDQKMSRLCIGFVLAMMLAMVVQLVPFPAGLIDSLRPEILDPATVLPDAEEGTRFISVAVGRTIESVIYVAAVAGIFLAVLRLKPDQVFGLLPFFFMGVICNLLAGAIQYSLAQNVVIRDFLPYVISAGLFSNSNHFAALLYTAIPMVVYYALYRDRLVPGVLGVLAILFILLAAGSRAGVLIGLAITVLSVFFLSARGRIGVIAGFVVFVSLSVYTLGAWNRVSNETLDPNFGRGEFARTTTEGIKENWPLGVGYGSFVRAYQIYEREDMIYRVYVNHAHNDYLEIVFEGGIVAALLVATYLLVLIAAFLRMSQTAMQRAALLSVTFLLLHSLVDYPLRTMALAMTFAWLNGIIFHQGFVVRAKAKPTIEVDHDGKRVKVPVAASA